MVLCPIVSGRCVCIGIIEWLLVVFDDVVLFETVGWSYVAFFLCDVFGVVCVWVVVVCCFGFLLGVFV